MTLNKLTARSITQKNWNFDVIVCSLFLLLSPYFILDVLTRTLTGNNRFQFDWIFIVVACLRLMNIFLSHWTLEKQFLSFALKIFTPLFLVIAYTLFITTFQVDFLADNNIYFGAISNSFILKRGVKYVLYTMLALYFATVINTGRKFYIVLLFFVAGLCATEILGLVQEVIFLSAGIDIFPITRTRETGLFFESVTVNLSGIKFLRINSLSHEPKGLAGLMYILFIFKFNASALFYQAKNYVNFPSFFANYMKKTWPLTVLVLLLTFSSSGLISFSFVFMVTFFASLGNFISRGKVSSKLGISIFVLIVLALIAILFPEKITDFFDASILRRASGFFEERTIESLLYTGSTDPEDTAAIINILKFPQVMLTGIGFGGYSNLALPIVASLYGGGIPIESASAFSRNIVIELLFSSGIIGITGCLFFASRLFQNLRSYPDLVMSFGLVIIASFLLRSNEVVFFTFIGLMCASNYIVMIEARHRKIVV